MVVTELETLPQRFDFRVVCGATGSGKTRILEALAGLGAQVLDLEGLAAHKGSVLGALPDRPQPTQKSFETELFETLRGFDPERPVFVEAESRKIGRIQVPEALIVKMRASRCVAIDATRDARLEFLVRDYAYLGDDVSELQRKIDFLKGLQSNETIEPGRRSPKLTTCRRCSGSSSTFTTIALSPLAEPELRALPDAPSILTGDCHPGRGRAGDEIWAASDCLVASAPI